MSCDACRLDQMERVKGPGEVCGPTREQPGAYPLCHRCFAGSRLVRAVRRRYVIAARGVPRPA